MKTEVVPTAVPTVTGVSGVTVTSLPAPGATVTMATTGGRAAGSGGSSGAQQAATDKTVLDKRRLQELVKEVDPLEQLDDDVEEVC